MSYVYKVEFIRKVAAPCYGPHAYRNHYVYAVIPFGKGQAITTGAKAKAIAIAHAQKHMSGASAVMLWRLSPAGNGYGEPLWRESGEPFSTNWSAADRNRMEQPA